MKDLHQVLSQKQRDIERVRREIDALLFVIPLLAEDDRIEHRLTPTIVRMDRTQQDKSN